MACLRTDIVADHPDGMGFHLSSISAVMAHSLSELWLAKGLHFSFCLSGWELSAEWSEDNLLNILDLGL